MIISRQFILLIFLKVGSSYVVLIVPTLEKSNNPLAIEHLQLLSILQVIPSDCLTSRVRTTKTSSGVTLGWIIDIFVSVLSTWRWGMVPLVRPIKMAERSTWHVDVEITNLSCIVIVPILYLNCIQSLDLNLNTFHHIRYHVSVQCIVFALLWPASKYSRGTPAVHDLGVKTPYQAALFGTCIIFWWDFCNFGNNGILSW